MAAETGGVLGTPTLALDRKRSIALLAAALAIVVLVVAVPRLVFTFSHETTDDAYVDAVPALVSARISGVVVTLTGAPGTFVHKGDIVARLDDTDARLALARAQRALADAEDQADEAEHDAALAVTDYDTTDTKSQVLTQQALNRTQALHFESLSERQRSVASAQAVHEAQMNLTRALDQIDPAKVRYSVAQRALARLETLQRQGLVPATQYEAAVEEVANARAALGTTQAEVTAARAALDEAMARADSDRLASSRAANDADAQSLDVRLQQVERQQNSPETVFSKRDVSREREDEVRLARVDVEQAQHNLDETLLRAPVDGYVASRQVALGESLHAGDPVLVVEPAHGLFVTANFKETQIKRISPGAAAEIHIDSFPHLAVYGHVVAIGGASQSAVSLTPNTEITPNFVKTTQRIPVEVALDRIDGDASDRLRPGMSAEVSIRF